MDLLLGISLLFLTLITGSFGAYCATTSISLYKNYRYCLYGCCSYTGYDVCCSSNYNTYGSNFTSGLGTSVVWTIICSVGTVVTIVIVITVICCCRRRRGAPGMIVGSTQMQPMTISTSGVQTSYMQPGVAYPQGQPGVMYPQGQPGVMYPQGQSSGGYPQPAPGYPQQATAGYPQQPQPQHQDMKSEPSYYQTHPTALSDNGISTAPPSYESLSPSRGHNNAGYEDSNYQNLNN